MAIEEYNTANEVWKPTDRFPAMWNSLLKWCYRSQSNFMRNGQKKYETVVQSTLIYHLLVRVCYLLK